MWTDENRVKYNRDKRRYPSDVTDEEWAHVEPLIPPAKRGGRKREANMREVFNGVMYVLSTGSQWRYIPKDLPPKSTVYRYFCDWAWDGVLDRIHDALYVKCREQAEREASPAAAIIDRKTREKRRKRGARIDPHGYDAGNPSMNSGDQGQEAPRSRRYARLADGRHRSFRRHSGSRRRHLAAFDAVRPLSLSRKTVRRQRVSRADLCRRARRHSASCKDRDCQTLRSGERLRDLAQALDRRAVDRMAEPLSKTGQGLGEPQRHSPCLPPFRLHSTHATKALQWLTNFRDELLKVRSERPTMSDSLHFLTSLKLLQSVFLEM